MSFWTKLLTGAPAVDKVASTIQESAKSTFGLIDNAFYTDQEKATAKAEALKMYSELIKTTTQESTGTAEARRWFLQTITNFMMALALIGIVSEIAGYPHVAGTIKTYVVEWQFGWAFVSAVSFYYLTQFAAAATGAPKK